MRINKKSNIEPIDSDDEDDESDPEDEDDMGGKKSFEQVRFILNDRDFLYYITK
jgi:hypothetical protein